MRIGVWGAGTIGSGIVYRLVTTSFTTEILWINRSYREVELKVIDLEQGLAFAPTCRRVDACEQSDAPQKLSTLDLLIITLGRGVKPGQTREDLYPENKKIFEETVIPALRESKPAVTLVVTNPVDLMARLVQRAVGMADGTVVGLGTVVETARLRANLGRYLSPIRTPSEVWAYAVGTHDSNFVPVADKMLALGASIERESVFQEILGDAREEVVKAASRVKGDGEEAATQHPIVEGVVAVAEAIALNSERVFTVSVRDTATEGELFFSVPCAIGRKGVAWRLEEFMDNPDVAKALNKCRDGLRETLQKTGEL